MTEKQVHILKVKFILGINLSYLHDFTGTKFLVKPLNDTIKSEHKVPGLLYYVPLNEKEGIFLGNEEPVEQIKRLISITTSADLPLVISNSKNTPCAFALIYKAHLTDVAVKTRKEAFGWLAPLMSTFVTPALWDAGITGASSAGNLGTKALKGTEAFIKSFNPRNLISNGFTWGVAPAAASKAIQKGLGLQNELLKGATNLGTTWGTGIMLAPPVNSLFGGRN